MAARGARALVVLLVLSATSCVSAEQEAREREERRRAREAEVRRVQALQDETHRRTSTGAASGTVPLSLASVRVLDAENAVRFCREAWEAHAWAYAAELGGDPRTAALRLRKAIDDLERVRAGDLNVTLERTGGFPACNWVSGYYRADGVYVPGHPTGPVPTRRRHR